MSGKFWRDRQLPGGRLAFPNGKHDDQVDSMALLEWIGSRPGRFRLERHLNGARGIAGASRTAVGPANSRFFPLDFPAKGSIAVSQASGAGLRPTTSPDRVTGGTSGGGNAAIGAASNTEGGITMPKLTDTQLVILSAAAARDDDAVLPLPDSLKIKGGPVASVLESLLKKDLIAEQPATPGAAIWRNSDDGGRVTLVVTDAGQRAIGVAPEGEVAGAETVDKPAPRKSNRRAAQPKAATNIDAAAPPSVRPGTKTALLIDLLRRNDGASIDEIVAATGWQAHSVRGAISGTLKKKLGLPVASEKHNDRGRVYRITGAA